MKGSVIPVEKNLNHTIRKFLAEALDKECFEAVIIPKKVPSEDSFAYLIIKDKTLLEGTSPLPPVIPVQGAKAVSSLTRRGHITKKILAVMHPCEIRATVELLKLKQLSLDNLLFLSFDCPGVLPLSEYVENPGEGDQKFLETHQKWESEGLRPVCQICTEFSAPASDLHIGTLGAEEGKMFLIPMSPEGEQIMESFSLKMDDSLDTWEKDVNELKKERENKRKNAHQAMKLEEEGPDKFIDSFSTCINCHNCMRVCPVCYCRQCYFDSDAFKLPPENFIKRAEKRGSLRLPVDTLLFHLGRMSHMILSCVSCGTCEDACPMNIPVAQLFSLVADNAQKIFDYIPGRDKDEPLPAVIYQEEELPEVEKPYTHVYVKAEEKNV